MSRSKRNRKAKMARRQAARVEQLKKGLYAARAHLADLRERARIRTEIIDKLDVPEPVKNVFSALIDPVGFTHDMLRKRLAEGETDASEEMIPGRYEEEILAEGTVK